MKRNIYLTMTFLAASAALLLTGCDKEPEFQGMRLVAEGFDSGSKAAVNGNAAYWVDGETVRINGVDKAVVVSGSAAYLTDVDEPADGIYRALYPGSLNAASTLTSNSVTVAIPAVYVYRTDDQGRQALDLPMAAYGTSGERLVFRHLTAAITVEVVNNFGIDLAVDSIVVTSNSYQISGNRDITLGESLDVAPNGSPASAADRRVVVRFNGGTVLTVASGVTKCVQVPVLPVGDGNKFTISVATHNVDEAQMQYTFSRTQVTGGALPRKYMAYAAASFGGVFTVSADGHKVRFAPGNLQYFCSTSNPQWRFALHQYDNAVYYSGNYAENSQKWIDLFGFATSGCSGKIPYNTNNTYASYAPVSGINNIMRTDYDWGWYNAIINGGNVNHRWRILGDDEWSYIKTNYSSRLGNGKIGSIKGLIILPDDWTLPSGCSFAIGNTENNYTKDQWALMEVAGAVFLPANGYRNQTTHYTGGGYYWTDKYYPTDKKASWVYFDATGGLVVKSTPGSFNYYGYSVRPVRDVQ